MMKRLFIAVASRLIFVLGGGVKAARFLGVKVGDDSRIYTREFGTEPFLISIGSHTTITAGVKLLTHDGATWLAVDEKGRRYKYAPIRIGSRVFVGENAIILPGVSIADRVVVGAGSVVTKDVPSGSVVAGSPARVIGSYDDLMGRYLSELKSQHDLSEIHDYTERVFACVDNRHN